jgi:sporulation integral membrane protein YtvI
MGEENRGYLRAVLWWAGLVLAGYAVWRFLVPDLWPFVIAAFLAIVIDPVVDGLERWGWSRPVSTLVGMTVVIGGTLLAVAALINLLVHEVLQLTHQLPGLYRAGRHTLDHWLDQVIRGTGLHLPNTQTLVNSQLSTAYHVTATLLQAVLSVVVALPNAFLVAILALIAAFFLLRDKRAMGPVLEWLVPPAIRHRVPAARAEVMRGTLGFVRAQVFVVASTAVGTTLGLLLYGSHYAVILGLVAGLLDLVPYLGPTALLGPWAAVMAVTGHLVAAIELAAVLAGVALLRQLVEPRLLGGGTGLHPLTALVALYVGIRLFGPIGFIIGPITAVILKATARAARLPPFGD